MNYLQYKPKEFEKKGNWIFNWFSNMIPFNIPLVYQNIAYYSVENYYQAMKLENIDVCSRLVIAQLPPKKAKMAIRNKQSFTLRKDWNKEFALNVMKKGLEHKWNQEPFKSQLLTAPEMIIEWNNWRDTYWGVTLDGKGENHLGRLLMEIKTTML